jgi:hypothetical protein
MMLPGYGKNSTGVNQKMYEMWFPRRKNVLNATATLSRTYRRLEDRDLIFKRKRRALSLLNRILQDAPFDHLVCNQRRTCRLSRHWPPIHPSGQ